jgi:hypothetical protein
VLKNGGFEFVAVGDWVAFFFDAKCFSECRSLSFVTLESTPRLSRTEKEAFQQTGLVVILFAALFDVFGGGVF